MYAPGQQESREKPGMPLNPQGFALKHYLVKKFNEDAYLLTAEPKNWVLLSAEEFAIIRYGTLEKGLPVFEKMEKAGFIVTDENTERMVKEYRNKYEQLFQGISLHIINTTRRCNLACPYCYAAAVHPEREEYDMDTETADAVMDFIWQSPNRSIVIEFQGGEPLLNFPVIQHIMESIKRRKGKWVNFRIVTNLTKMDDDIARYFSEQKAMDICTSLDGPKEVHDKNRHTYTGGGSYEQVTYWVDRLRKEYGFGHIGMLPTITRHSLPYAREIVDEYIKHDVYTVTPNHIRLTGRAHATWKLIGYTPEEFGAFWKEMFDYCIDRFREGERTKEHFATMILRKALTNKPICHTCSSKPCGAALMQASYQHNGDVYTCDEGKTSDDFRLGNVKEKNYKEIYSTPEALNMVSLSSGLGLMCDTCVWTNFCSFCAVVTKNTSGNMIPKLAADFECKIKMIQNEETFRRLALSKDRRILEQWVKEPDVLMSQI